MKTAKKPIPERVMRAQALNCEMITHANGNGKIAVIYGRVSSPKQAIDSIYGNQRQRSMAGKAVDLNYSAIIAIFGDLAGVSGALGPEHRPGFALLCTLVEEGVADDVFVLDFTRLVREKVIGLDFATLCIQNSVTIINESGRVLDPSDKVGLILYVVELTESVEERNRINSRLQGSRRKKAEQGRNPGASINVGFYIDPRLPKEHEDYHRLLLYAPHARFVEFVLRKSIELGNRYKAIRKACLDAGYGTLPPFEGPEIRQYMETRTALRRSPRDEAGNYVVRSTLIVSVLRRFKRYMGVFEWASHSEWGPPIHRENNHEVLIDPAYEDEFKLMFEKGKKQSLRGPTALPLTGLINSLNNGPEPTPVQAMNSTGHHGRYTDQWAYNRNLSDGTRWTLRRELVEEPICEVVFNRLKLPDYSAQVAAELDDNRQAALEQVERFRASRERLEREIKNLQANFAYISHPDDVTSLRGQIDARRAELTDLEEKAQESDVGKDWNAASSLDEYREFLTDLSLLWGTSTDLIRNRLLRLILRAIYIDHQGRYFDATIVWFNKQEDHIRVHIPVLFRNKQDWLPDEIAYVKANYVNAPWDELTARLHRTERAILIFAEWKLGLKKENGKHKQGFNTPWSVEESEIVRAYADSKMSYEDLRTALPDRTENAVLSHLRHMGLSHPRKPFWHTLPLSSDLSSRKILAICTSITSRNTRLGR